MTSIIIWTKFWSGLWCVYDHKCGRRNLLIFICEYFGGVNRYISAGGLKLNQKQKRYTRYIKRKKRNGKIKKIKVVVDNPKWISHSFFPYKMLHKRYQALLIEHLKKRIKKILTLTIRMKTYSSFLTQMY